MSTRFLLLTWLLRRPSITFKTFDSICSLDRPILFAYSSRFEFRSHFTVLPRLLVSPILHTMNNHEGRLCNAFSACSESSETTFFSLTAPCLISMTLFLQTKIAAALLPGTPSWSSLVLRFKQKFRNHLYRRVYASFGVVHCSALQLLETVLLLCKQKFTINTATRFLYAIILFYCRIEFHTSLAFISKGLHIFLFIVQKRAPHFYHEPVQTQQNQNLQFTNYQQLISIRRSSSVICSATDQSLVLFCAGISIPTKYNESVY